MTFHSIVNKLLLLFFLCMAGTVTYADDSKDFPAPSSRLVNDYGGFLSPAEISALEQKLVAYSDSTSTQIAIVTMKSIGDYEIADYADRLANKWEIGKKGKNNGLLILMTKEPHGITIRTGYGMEGTLPDAITKRLIEQIAKPNFKQNNYYGGLDKLTDAIIQIMSGTYQADDKATASGSKAIFIFVILMVVIALLSIFSKRGGGGNGMGGNGGGGFLAGMLLGGLGSGGFSSRGGYSGGSGGFGGGGSFGGFGGGGFGGGGASGSW
jgi:uncharacterized protein